MMHSILVADDEAPVRWSLVKRLGRDGHSVREAATAAVALEQAFDVDLVLLDQRLPDSGGLTVLRTLKEWAPDTVVIFMAAYSTIEDAVDAMKLGAFHYVNKPLDVDEVALLVGKALEARRLRHEVEALRRSTSRDYGFDAVVGSSPPMMAVKALLKKVAASHATTVLLIGETGTGKDLAARAIHHNSDRAGLPFVNITCSALPEPLLESELFGHECGAFTDVGQQKRGLLETAGGGTVFLDEIGEMTPALQAKLLRFLEERTFRRVGGLRDIAVDVRVIAATHRDLAQAVTEGRFRKDLFYRLQVMPIVLPPLRERKGDIALLASHYIGLFNREFKKRVRGLQPETLEMVENHRWPGNVRELRNAIERAMLLIDREWLEPADFTALSRSGRPARFPLPPGGVRLEEVERQLVVQALERAGGNQTRAGHLLGINRDQVRYRIEKFGLR